MNPMDLQILSLLQSDARITNAEIARQVGMAPSAVLERVRKLEERGVIERYEARLDPKAFGLGLTAYCLVRTTFSDSTDQAKRLAAIPEIQEVHEVAGEDCFLIKLRARDTDALSVLLREKIACIPGVTSTKTTIVLKTEKETGTLPLPTAGKSE